MEKTKKPCFQTDNFNRIYVIQKIKSYGTVLLYALWNFSNSNIEGVMLLREKQLVFGYFIHL